MQINVSDIYKHIWPTFINWHDYVTFTEISNDIELKYVVLISQIFVVTPCKRLELPLANRWLELTCYLYQKWMCQSFCTGGALSGVLFTEVTNNIW